MIRQIVPGLEQPYVQLMLDWQQLFDRTRERALKALSRSGESNTAAGQADHADENAQLIADAQAQTREFARQLGLLQQHSEAVRRMPGSSVLLGWLQNELAGGWQADDSAMHTQLRASEYGDSWSSPLGDASANSGKHHADAAAGNAVPIGGHTLPPLPYAYNALEPWIDETTMRIHHDKHHQAYVNGLNTAEKKLKEARASGDFSLVKHWERELAFNGAGHYLHTIFWDAMSPKGGGEPTGALAKEIAASFGSYAAFKKQFSEAAAQVEGGSWAILVWSPRSRRLEILTAEKHQNLSQWDVVPLLPLDVWEHAYYLKHQNNRAAYVRDWWNTVNWPYVAERFAQARQLVWKPY